MKSSSNVLFFNLEITILHDSAASKHRLRDNGASVGGMGDVHQNRFLRVFELFF